MSREERFFSMFFVNGRGWYANRPRIRPAAVRRDCFGRASRALTLRAATFVAGQSPLPRRKRRALNGAVGRFPLVQVRRGTLPTLDSVPPHGTSPLRGKHASRFVHPALPHRKRCAPSGAVGGVPRGANLESPSEWLHIRAPCGAGKGGAPDGCGRRQCRTVTKNMRCGHALRNVSSGSMPDETCRLRSDRRGNV